MHYSYRKHIFALFFLFSICKWSDWKINLQMVNKHGLVCVFFSVTLCVFHIDAFYLVDTNQKKLSSISWNILLFNTKQKDRSSRSINRKKLTFYKVKVIVKFNFKVSLTCSCLRVKIQHVKWETKTTSHL